jgi:hypothetical protein
MTDENQTDEKQKRTISEEIEVAGGQLVERLQEIVKQGNIRRIIVRTSEGRELLNTTVTVGAVAGGALALIGGLPLAALGLVAAALARVKIEIVREVKDGDVLPDDGKRRIEITEEEEEAGDKA